MNPSGARPKCSKFLTRGEWWLPAVETEGPSVRESLKECCWGETLGLRTKQWQTSMESLIIGGGETPWLRLQTAELLENGVQMKSRPNLRQGIQPLKNWRCEGEQDGTVGLLLRDKEVYCHSFMPLPYGFHHNRVEQPLPRPQSLPWKEVCSTVCIPWNVRRIDSWHAGESCACTMVDS